ncbi:2Fe-2S iron-sulfur cluster-binding protein [Capnocytophaga sp.]|uniref:2Fe-2S iron-sulfur cluster-binding protein n=1 Tax=Capnocytophaga sp. TaxID=44737 RepID=UPI0026DCA663|nr:2Fe-2S iron-sulfur cluster-binding protein [Capnocytophaga sp.]MDO5105291.1 2Fe-2S iron-sulfur cluster-binding protein [Capnocytophaga sp.]
MNRFYSLKVSKIESLTEQSVKITFNLPEQLKNEFSFDAGQYLTLQKTIQNQKVRRSYSICSATDKLRLSIAVKRVPNGIFSTYLTTVLKEGEALEVMPPQGKFTFVPEFFQVFDTKSIMLFAAGSGITPMMSIIKTALAKTAIKIVLVFGNKSKEETLFFSEIESLKAMYPTRFLVHYVFSQKATDGNFFGRIDEKLLEDVLSRYQQLDFERYYLCGQSKMIINLREKMLILGISTDKIATEFFEVTESKNDFLQSSGNVLVTLDYNGKNLVFEADKKQSLLQAVLNQGIEVPYSCVNGVCSSCMAKVVEGKVQMVKNETLVQKEIDEGWVLMCQAYAFSDAVKVVY